MACSTHEVSRPPIRLLFPIVRQVGLGKDEEDELATLRVRAVDICTRACLETPIFVGSVVKVISRMCIRVYTCVCVCVCAYDVSYQCVLMAQTDH